MAWPIPPSDLDALREINRELHTAIAAKDYEAMESLLAKGGSFNHTAEELEPDRMGMKQPALLTAIKTRDVALVRWLLEKGADPNRYFTDRGASGDTTLLSAAAAVLRGGEPEILDALIEYGADLNATLHAFIVLQSPALVARALEWGASPDAPHNGVRPLERAAQTGNRNSFEKLLYRGANPYPDGNPKWLYDLVNLHEANARNGMEEVHERHLDVRNGYFEYASWVKQQAKTWQRKLLYGTAPLEERASDFCKPQDGKYPLNCLLATKRVEKLFAEEKWKGREPELLALHEMIAASLSPRDANQFRTDVDISWARRELLGTSVGEESKMTRWARRPNASGREVG